MRFDPPPDPDSDLLDLTSMVDVVFILLAFFVITARFFSAEVDLTLGADSEAPSVQGLSPEDLPSEILVVLRTAEDGVAIQLGQRELAINGFDDLTGLLNELDMEQVPVRIASDPTLSVDQLASAMDAVLAGPGDQISLAELSNASPDEAQRETRNASLDAASTDPVLP